MLEKAGSEAISGVKGRSIPSFPMYEVGSPENFFDQLREVHTTWIMVEKYRRKRGMCVLSQMLVLNCSRYVL